MANINLILPLIRTESLAKVYSLGKIRIEALRDVSLAIPAGAFVAVTGTSGSGKSTLLNLLGGLDTPTSGAIEVQGKRISDMEKPELARYRRSGVGMIFQAFNLIHSRSALENVELPLLFSNVAKKERRQRAKEILAAVGLSARGHHRPAELSGGEQQRVAIARALINQPKILLADEPTGNLDSRTARDIVSLLARLNRHQELTVVLVTHEEHLAREFAAKIFRLQDGRLAGQEEVS